MNAFSPRAIFVTFVLCLGLSSSPLAFSTEPNALVFEHALGKSYACSVSFLAEDELVVLASPSSRCYEALDSLELVALSLDGRVIARRPWTSTNPGVVLRPERLVLPQPGGAEVLDKELKTIQTIRLAKRGGPPSISATDTGLLSITFDDRTLHYSGTPLKEVAPPDMKPSAEGIPIVSTLDGSWELLRSGSSLLETRPGAKPRKFADLGWVVPVCSRPDTCHVEQTDTHFQTVLGRHSRVLIASRASGFSITNSFGLVPSFRVEVFDLDSGSEVFREEDFFRTAERQAVLSPDGDRLVVSDGYTAVIHTLD